MAVAIPDTLTIGRELVGASGTLVFGTVPAMPATILRVGDGYLVARHVRRDRSPAGELVTDELVIPLSALVYFRRTTTEDPDDA